MPSPDTPPPESPRGPGYETRDVDPKVIIWLVGSIVVVVGASMIGLRLLVDTHSASAARQEPPLVSTVDQTPPSPRLQTTPVRDYQTFVAEQDARLHSYGWVDRQQGIVHIPIERAMDRAVEKGLPPATPSTDQPPPSDGGPAATQE